MDAGTRFLILSLEGETYGLPIARLIEITMSQNIQQDRNLTGMFEGKFDFRGKSLPVLNIKKIFKIPGMPGKTLLVVKSDRGMLGLLVDAVTEILDTKQKPVPVPKGVINPSLQYYRGILRHKENLVLLLNEDSFLP